MTTLTRQKLLQRTKQRDLSQIHNLNLWGQDLTEISIVSQLPNLQVLSLSINKITDLSPLQKCTKLKELYLRKNGIQSLNQLNYLTTLPLTTIWLSENPAVDELISQKGEEFYRFFVLSKLPHLIKLDSKDVTPYERQQVSSLANLQPISQSHSSSPSHTSRKNSIDAVEARKQALKYLDEMSNVPSATNSAQQTSAFDVPVGNRPNSPNRTQNPQKFITEPNIQTRKPLVEQFFGQRNDNDSFEQIQPMNSQSLQTRHTSRLHSTTNQNRMQNSPSKQLMRQPSNANLHPQPNTFSKTQQNILTACLSLIEELDSNHLLMLRKEIDDRITTAVK